MGLLILSLSVQGQVSGPLIVRAKNVQIKRPRVKNFTVRL